MRSSLIVITIVVVAVIAGAVINGAPSATVDTEKSSALPVNVVSPERVESVTQQRLYSGIITAARRARLAFERPARLQSVEVEEGDSVKTGQVLAKLDRRQLDFRIDEFKALLAQQRAILQELNAGARTETITATAARRDSLNADLELSQSTFARIQNLYRKGATSEQALDEARLKAASIMKLRDAAAKEFEELSTGIRDEKKVAQQAQVDATQAKLQQLLVDAADSELKAPWSGTIVRRLADEGDMMSVSQPVIELLESGKLEARIGVPTSAAARIASTDYQILHVNDRDFSADVIAVLPEVDPVTRTQTVVLSVPAEETERLADGQLVKLRFSDETAIDGLRVPIASLAPGSRGLWLVFAANESDGKTILESRSVEVLHTDGDFAIVQGELSAADRIIADGVHRVVPGQQVVINDVE